MNVVLVCELHNVKITLHMAVEIKSLPPHVLRSLPLNSFKDCGVGINRLHYPLGSRGPCALVETGSSCQWLSTACVKEGVLTWIFVPGSLSQ